LPVDRRGEHSDPCGAACAEFTLADRGRFWTFTRPASPDAILDAMSEEQYRKDQFLPYWAEYWPSSEALLSFLHGRPIRSAARACELGAGLGVIAAIMNEQGLWTAAVDLSFDACRFARVNMHRLGNAAPAVCADWRAMPFGRAFDLIAGADILYEARWIDPVARAISALLSDTGEAFIADPCRRHWRRFLKAAGEQGLDHEIIERRSINDNKTTIEIARIARAPARQPCFRRRPTKSARALVKKSSTRSSI
jgi:SAM-dependent methyltransferase